MGCGCKKKPVPTTQTTQTSGNSGQQQQDKLINEIIDKVKQINR